MKKIKKILFITTPLYDYLADSLLIGLRKIYGQNCIEFPRKKMMYGEFPSVYGKGFTIWSKPIKDIKRNKKNFEDIDLVIYSDYRRQSYVDWRILAKNKKFAPRIIYLDGYDDNYVNPKLKPYFKRELYKNKEGVFPVGFGIPSHLIRPLNIDKKTQLYQTHVQDTEFTKNISYKFNKEKDYYDDLAKSYFGITMKKGGWDCMRHYELLAAGALIMFKNFKFKPKLCNPQCPYFVNYSNKKDFMNKIEKLFTNNKPNSKYHKILKLQRKWLLENATCSARAKKLIEDVEAYYKEKQVQNMPLISFKLFKIMKIKFYEIYQSFVLRIMTLVKSNSILFFLYSKLKRLLGLEYLVNHVLVKQKKEYIK